MGNHTVPIYRVGRTPHLYPVVNPSLRSTHLSSASAALAHKPTHEDAVAVHRLLGHTHPQCYVLTATQSVVGLKPVTLSAFTSPTDSHCMPCSPCACHRGEPQVSACTASPLARRIRSNLWNLSVLMQSESLQWPASTENATFFTHHVLTQATSRPLHVKPRTSLHTSLRK
jgi:hypothetical protein